MSSSCINNNKVVNATKWSAITELIAKIINPITSMVLARLLAPEAFGVVAIISMIISFAEIFTDAGFQKYIIQHEFKDSKEKYEYTDVAFWSNLLMSFLIWGIIIVFRNPIAYLVGSPGLGFALVIACVSIPLAAFSSIQTALYRRDFNFKTLFKVRMVSVCVPLLFTIPLAYFLRNFWALIIGTIMSNIINAVILTYFSKWKPRLRYSYRQFKSMFSFSFWSMIEAVSIWLTSYVDIFIVGVVLNQYYLGLYNTSITIVGQITAVITSITTPVLFSALSRLQSDRKEFEMIFFKFQKLVGILVMPLGVYIYMYRVLITTVLLGEQWKEAAFFIGIWGLSSSLAIVLAHFCSEVYRSLGKPLLSVLAQWLHIIVLWPVVLFAVKSGFDSLCIARTLVRIEFIAVHLTIMYYVVHISIIKMLLNIMPALFSSVIMSLTSIILLSFSDNMIWMCVSMIISGFLYLASVCLFKEEKSILQNFVRQIKIQTKI